MRLHRNEPLNFPDMRNSIFNLILGAVGFVGSLTLPEIAASLAGFGTFAWMAVQCAIAIRKSRRGSCSRTNCPRRSE